MAEGLAIYLPNRQSKTYWVRVRIAKKDVKKSTGERDPSKAKEKAYFIKFQLEDRFNKGLPVIASKTLNALSDGFLEHLHRNVAAKSIHIYIRYFNRYLLPDWGNKAIDEIKAINIITLFDKYELSETSNGKYTRFIIKQLFDYAEINEYIKPSSRPLIPSFKYKETESFDLFSPSELKEVLDEINRVKEKAEIALYDLSMSNQDRKTNERFVILSTYYEVLSRCGARPGTELLNCRFRDLSITGKNLGGPLFPLRELNLNILGGKMGKRTGGRKIPLNMNASISLDYYCRSNFKKDYDYLIKNEPDRYIFSHRKTPNETVGTARFLIDILDDLKSKNLISKTKRLAAYSFRHSYITYALAQKIDVYLLAVSVGTSVNLIKNVYSRMSSILRSSELHKIDILFSEKIPPKKAIKIEDDNFSKIINRKNDDK